MALNTDYFKGKLEKKKSGWKRSCAGWEKKSAGFRRLGGNAG